jgi:hypothetical protein
VGVHKLWRPIPAKTVTHVPAEGPAESTGSRLVGAAEGGRTGAKESKGSAGPIGVYLVACLQKARGLILGPASDALSLVTVPQVRAQYLSVPTVQTTLGSPLVAVLVGR